MGYLLLNGYHIPIWKCLDSDKGHRLFQQVAKCSRSGHEPRGRSTHYILDKRWRQNGSLEAAVTGAGLRRIRCYSSTLFSVVKPWQGKGLAGSQV